MPYRSYFLPFQVSLIPGTYEEYDAEVRGEEEAEQAGKGKSEKTKESEHSTVDVNIDGCNDDAGIVLQSQSQSTIARPLSTFVPSVL
jgi:hypothetical protein